MFSVLGSNTGTIQIHQAYLYPQKSTMTIQSIHIHNTHTQYTYTIHIKECWLGPWYPAVPGYHRFFFTKQGTSHHTRHRLEGTKGTTGRYHRYFLHHVLSWPSLYTVQPACQAGATCLASRCNLLSEHVPTCLLSSLFSLLGKQDCAHAGRCLPALPSTLPTRLVSADMSTDIS
jgi:hypothetical protein